MEREEVLELAYKYVLSVAKNKQYNIQMKAILNEFNGFESKELKIYLSEFEEFNKGQEQFICKDFVYKNNLSTYRNFYIVSPSLYLYYTFQVFELYFSVFQDENICDFSNMDVYYSGNIVNDFSKVKLHSDFNYSYNEFQEKQKEFAGNHVLITDIQSFFDGISSNYLFEKIRVLCNKDRDKIALKNLREMFKVFKIESLPQLHYSVASSVLSQFYLFDVSKEVNELLEKNNWTAVRFVDDFYINLKSKHSYKDINRFLHEYSSLLFKDNLNLNINKTKKLTPKKYENKLSDIETLKNNYGELSSLENYIKFIPKKHAVNFEVKNKIDELLENNAKKLMNFVKEVSKVFETYGLDLERYNRKVKKYISINGEDASKVIKSLMFSKEWKTKIGKSNLEEIVKCTELVFFDPINFTIFYCLIDSYLELDNQNKFEVFENFYNAPLRILIIFEQLTVQGHITKHEFLKMKQKFEEVDTNSTRYLEKYIFK